MNYKHLVGFVLVSAGLCSMLGSFARAFAAAFSVIYLCLLFQSNSQVLKHWKASAFNCKLKRLKYGLPALFAPCNGKV